MGPSLCFRDSKREEEHQIQPEDSVGLVSTTHCFREDDVERCYPREGDVEAGGGGCGCEEDAFRQEEEMALDC